MDNPKLNLRKIAYLTSQLAKADSWQKTNDLIKNEILSDLKKLPEDIQNL